MANKRVAILQSNYIPWKGYFDLIASVDEFILYDDVQYTKNDWRNRNIIKSIDGTIWLSIPTGQNIDRRIRDVEVNNHKWKIKHWKSLVQNYQRASCFDEIASIFEPIYLKNKLTNLSSINRLFIEAICSYLGIKTIISNSWDYNLAGNSSERLVNLCLQTGCAEYVSGPAAKNYLNEALFLNQGINVDWFDYSSYPEYPQLWGEFIHHVSILDLLFNCGLNSSYYMRYVSR